MKRIKEEYKEYSGDLYLAGKNEVKKLREKGTKVFELIAKTPKGYIVLLPN